MGRWQALIDDVIADLEAETPGLGARLVQEAEDASGCVITYRLFTWLA
jgi:hypothetical protein